MPSRSPRSCPPTQPDGMTTYLDAGMVDLAQVAGAMRLPFHSQTDGDCAH